jgi:hypothetical protein
MPTVLRQPDGTERLVYNAMWKGRFDLYVTDAPEPIGPPEQTQIAAMPAAAEELPRFQPDIQVPIDDANKEDYGGWRMFLEGADSFIGVNDDQTFVGRIVMSFTDYLGDKRLIADLSTVESFSDFEIVYIDLSNRLQWAVSLFDQRDFYTSESTTGDIDRERQAVAVTGARASLIYPTSFKSRFDFGAGYMVQTADLLVAFDPFTGAPIFQEFDLDFPFLIGGFTNDTAIYTSAGPISGRRLRIDAQWAPDVDEGGTLNESIDLDFRQYIPLTRRSNLALRLFGGAADGNNPVPIYFGGLDTLRGFEFREFAGTRVIFFDVGGAWYHDFEEFDLWDSDNNQFQDGRASYGFGLSVRFLGLPMNWDFAKQYRFDGAEDGYGTSFWIGTRF